MNEDQWLDIDARRAVVEGWLASPRVGPSPPAYRHYLIRQVAAQDTTLAAPQVEGKMAPLT